jgi:sugar O-acyltransferase (sialic acid O-acetyltransferase NeuD family)
MTAGSKMKQLIIYGTGMYAELADFYFTHDVARTPIAFTTHAEFKDRDQYLGRPVIPFESLQAMHPPESHELFVAISYNKLNSIRARRVADARACGYSLISYVSTKAITWPQFSCGENCFILEMNFIQPFVKIGNNVTLWGGNRIGHHSTIEDDCYLAAATLGGKAVIGQGSFVGANATIRDGVRVGKRCVVGAGALVLRDLSDESVVAAQESKKSSVPSSRLRSI